MLQLTKSGGVLTVVGMGASHNVELLLFNALSREVDIRGVFRYANECVNKIVYLEIQFFIIKIWIHLQWCYVICFSYKDALSLIASGQIDLKPLITHHFKIEESLEAFRTAETGVGNPIKVMIHCDENLPWLLFIICKSVEVK